MPRIRRFLSAVAASAFLAVAARGSVLTTGGIGLPVRSAGARAAGMGGVSIGQADPTDLSVLNPASLHRVGLTQLVLEFGAESNRYRGPEGSAPAPYANFSGFTFAMPLGHGLGVALGLAPHTRSQYALSFDSELDGQAYAKSLHSAGGLNSADVTVYYSFRSVVGLGVTAHYFFGKITENWRVTYAAAGFTKTRNQLTTRFSAGGATAGLVLHPAAWLSLGAAARPAVRLDTRGELYGNPLSSLPETQAGAAGFPAFGGAGFRARVTGALAASADAAEERWDRLTVNGKIPGGLRRSLRISAGAEWLRGRLPTDPYFSRVAVRAGFSTKRFYMADASGGPVREWTASVGFGLPLKSASSRLDVAVGAGRRGSFGDNGMEETLFRVDVAATLAEKWFQRN
jgi:hypothetical protein